MHNERNMSRIKTLGERPLKEKGVKLQSENDTGLSDDENRDEGLYYGLKAWNPASGSKARARYMQMQLQLEQQGEASKQL